MLQSLFRVSHAESELLHAFSRSLPLLLHLLLSITFLFLSLPASLSQVSSDRMQGRAYFSQLLQSHCISSAFGIDQL